VAAVIRPRAAHAAALAVAIVLLIGGAPAFGHGLDPAFLSLRDAGGGVFDVTWRTAAERLPGANVQPILPARCRQIGPANSEVGPDHVTLRWAVNCGGHGLSGETIGVQDLDAAKINALLRVEEAGRPTVQVVLNPARTSFAVPEQPSSLDVVRDYAALGVEHILTGPDHLLFVFGMLLLVPRGIALLKTVTAFTLGHSITLSAAALGIAAVPSRPIELLIALSVLALAVELTGAADRATPLRRFPWLMAAGFGLLHGFGFAGALAETGLPAGDIPVALLSFNAGIEVGQLCFVAVVLLAGAAARRSVPAALRMRHGAVYSMGVLAAFWCIERAVEWLG
jgi:hydrogenase/urease accessory protein HupE